MAVSGETRGATEVAGVCVCAEHAHAVRRPQHPPPAHTAEPVPVTPRPAVKGSYADLHAAVVGKDAAAAAESPAA